MLDRALRGPPSTMAGRTESALVQPGARPADTTLAALETCSCFVRRAGEVFVCPHCRNARASGPFASLRRLEQGKQLTDRRAALAVDWRCQLGRCNDASVLIAAHVDHRGSRHRTAAALVVRRGSQR